jgi:hypothetical protein
VLRQEEIRQDEGALKLGFTGILVANDYACRPLRPPIPHTKQAALSNDRLVIKRHEDGVGAASKVLGVLHVNRQGLKKRPRSVAPPGKAGCEQAGG